MSTELKPLNDMNFEEVAALTGAFVQEKAIVIPQLKINRDPDYPMGQFTVSQGDTLVFGPVVTFRPFINAYQYVEWSPSEKIYTNSSLIIKNFQEEALDRKGGVACGKVPFKQLAELTADEQLRQKNIKCRRLLYGLLTIPDAKTPIQEGSKTKYEATEVLELPVVCRLSGRGFMAPDVALKSISKLKHQYFQHNLTFSTTRKKDSPVIAYDLGVEVDLKNMLEFTSDNMDVFRMFQDSIDRENSFVARSWKQVKEEALKDLDKSNPLLDLDLNDNIDDL